MRPLRSRNFLPLGMPPHGAIFFCLLCFSEIAWCNNSLTILDPVNLSSGFSDVESGRMLRRAIAHDPNWAVLSGDSISRNMRDNGLDPLRPCAEFQCAYDAGNALQTEYVLFGTTASLPEMRTYTLDLIHVPTSQVVWSRVGQSPYRSSVQKQSRKGHVLEGSLAFAVSDLDPNLLQLRKPPSLGLLGVMDAGKSTPQSRVALHRAITHAYASRAYDLLGPGELTELLVALEIPKPSPVALADGTGPYDGLGSAAASNREGMAGTVTEPSGEPLDETVPIADMQSIGSKLGVRYLLWTSVKTQGREYETEMTLYDVAGRKLVKHWPATASTDFSTLVNLEDRFLTALSENAPRSQASRVLKKSKAKSFSRIATIGLVSAAGATLGYMAYQNKQGADSDYRKFQAARSKQEAIQARQRVIAKDTEAKKFGALGGLSLAIGAAVWVF